MAIILMAQLKAIGGDYDEFERLSNEKYIRVKG